MCVVIDLKQTELDRTPRQPLPAAFRACHDELITLIKYWSAGLFCSQRFHCTFAPRWFTREELKTNLL